MEKYHRFSYLFLTALLLLLITSITCAQPELIVSPQNADMQTAVNLRVIGLASGEKIVLSATLQDEFKRTWQSFATFIADNNGNIDPAQQAPVSGTYSGIAAQGLFWSMQLDSSAALRGPFWQSGTAPLPTQIIAQLPDGTMLRATLDRYIQQPDLQKITIQENGLSARLLMPVGNGPFPAIIVSGDSAGHLPSDAILAQFANRGYATLGLSNKTDITNTTPLSNYEKAIVWLQQQSTIKADRLALIGGGANSLIVATQLPAVKAVATFVGGGMVLEVFSTNNDAQLLNTLSRQPPELPFINNFPSATTNKTTDGSLPQNVQAYLNDFTQQTNRLEQLITHTIHSDGVTANLLQQMEKQTVLRPLAKAFSGSTLLARKQPAVYQFIAYNTDHRSLFADSLPYTPSPLNTQFLTTQNDVNVALSDAARNLADAEVDKWQQLFAFLDRYVGNFPSQQATVTNSG